MTKLAEVNTSDIVGAIALGCQTMGRVFNADDNNVPFFSAAVLPKPYLGFQRSHSESHIPGRHLNALLTAEEVLGIPIPDQVIELHADAAYFSYSGATPLPLNRDEIDGELNRFLPHNLREGFHALYALTRYRDSQPARELASRSIEEIRRLWSSESGWDVEAFRNDLKIELVEWDGPFITGIARAIGPLVKFHRATKYGPALDLAIQLKDIAIDHYFTSEGAFDRNTLGNHTHSTTCVMSSLAQLADFTDDESLFDRVEAFYTNGLKQISDGIGWSIENCGPDRNPDMGEGNNTGDIIETALVLGRRRHPSYFQDAERITRSHLLPSQLRDISFVPESVEDGDGAHDVAARLRGAFGFPAPYGHVYVDAQVVLFNLDITGGSVASLCEVVREAVSIDKAGTTVNMFFDLDDERVRIESPYTHDSLGVTIKHPGNLTLHLPGWVDVSSIRFSGSSHKPKIDGQTVVIPDLARGDIVTLVFDLPVHESVLEHRTRSIKVKFRGDEVIAMSNFGMDHTFFDDL
jgi:hypothetical protein